MRSDIRAFTESLKSSFSKTVTSTWCDAYLKEKGIMARKTKSRMSKRELIAPKGSKRYVRRNPKGQFKKEVSVGRSLASDRRRQAKTKVRKGQGDHGDTV
jgi:hypothetical protein